ncbi:cytochrome P450 family protein [Amycolatopsis anabasis]|uniref:cytochrome P450 family protein n=1 Tax=Amycolatopsis anabasis TaxID=1840409 RepID=UPI00131B61D3|nr:cytochrome P450 [Amycolatopsis anabasis]
MTIESPATPFDHQHFANPDPTFARLREEGPVHRIQTPDGYPIWLVTREADVRAALADPRLALGKAHAGDGYTGFSLPPALDANLLNRDGADHIRLRKLAAAPFSARRAEALRERVHTIADELADAIAERGNADLIAEFALPLPLSVVGELLGIPDADRRSFAEWTSSLLTPAHRGQVAESVREIHHLLLRLIESRRAEPGDDLLSAWITARDEADRLSEDELISLAFLVLWAGIENVTHVIGHGTLLLLREPETARALRDDPAGLATAVEEMLRYTVPPVVSIRRFARAELEIGGVTIPAGHTVMLGLASANRDPARFTDPERFDPARTENPHLAFGHGPHYCLGAPLARIELTTAFDVLLRRFPALALAVPEADLRWRPSFRMRALVELPVTV